MGSRWLKCWLMEGPQWTSCRIPHIGRLEKDRRCDQDRYDAQGLRRKYFSSQGVLNVELTIGSKTLLTTFFVINGKGSYSLLLARDCLHANYCVPSTMHQCLTRWQGNGIEVASADTTVSVAAADTLAWEFEGIECLSGKVWEGEFLQMSEQGLKPIQAC
jgi:hypothetical protein